MVLKIKEEVTRNPEKYRTIIGVDSASTGIAWTYLFDGHMAGQGKIGLTKHKDMQSKLIEIYKEWRHILDEVKPDHIFIEKSIFVVSPGTARTLSYIVGALMIVALGEGYEVTDVEPATWKSFLGYKNLRKGFVADATASLGRIEGKKFCDKLRKSQTWRVIKYNYPDEVVDSIAQSDNDISDSWGIALYGYDKLAKELALDKSKEVTLDLEELSSLGLSL